MCDFKIEMKKTLHIALFMLSLAIFSNPYWVIAQEDKPMTRILLMLDGSQSMGTGWGNSSKIGIAKSVIKDVVDSLKEIPNVQLALRVYGHQYHYSLNNCKDTRLEVGFRNDNYILLKSRLREIKPSGITPIAYSLEKAARDFPHDNNARNIVIIITDGEESCSGDPCMVSRELQRKNLILKPFVIGLGYQSELKTNLDCIGAYYEANTPAEFKQIIRNIVIRVLDQTTVQVDLLDIFSNPTETDVNLSFTNNISKTALYNYYHTKNPRGDSDTLEVDPINTYDLIVHTIPPITVKNIYLRPNMHNVIKIPAAQGTLKVTMQNSNTRYNANILCLIREKGSGKTLNIQQINTVQEYLTGVYEVEILSLPRIIIKDIEVNQSETTNIQIPEPGLLTLNSTTEVYGGIFRIKENKTDKIYQLNDRILKESILLQPGNYIINYRNKLRRNSASSVTKKFRIKSGESITLKL